MLGEAQEWFERKIQENNRNIADINARDLAFGASLFMLFSSIALMGILFSILAPLFGNPQILVEVKLGHPVNVPAFLVLGIPTSFLVAVVAFGVTAILMKKLFSYLSQSSRNTRININWSGMHTYGLFLLVSVIGFLAGFLAAPDSSLGAFTGVFTAFFTTGLAMFSFGYYRMTTGGARAAANLILAENAGGEPVLSPQLEVSPPPSAAPAAVAGPGNSSSSTPLAPPTPTSSSVSTNLSATFTPRGKGSKKPNPPEIELPSFPPPKPEEISKAAELSR